MLSMGYNFGCMIASDTLFDCRGWVFGVKLSDEDIAEIECLSLRVVAMAAIFLLSIYGVHIGATWRIRLNCPRAARCGFMSNYFDHLFSTCRMGVQNDTRVHGRTVFTGRVYRPVNTSSVHLFQ